MKNKAAAAPVPMTTTDTKSTPPNSMSKTTPFFSLWGNAPLKIAVVAEEESSGKVTLRDFPTSSAAVGTVTIDSIFVTTGDKINCVHGQIKFL